VIDFRGNNITFPDFFAHFPFLPSPVAWWKPSQHIPSGDPPTQISWDSESLRYKPIWIHPLWYR
jgi:hypothetical protein